jgi:hypothetical protein
MVAHANAVLRMVPAHRVRAASIACTIAIVVSSRGAEVKDRRDESKRNAL